jgi:hypothetical protein
MAVLKAVLLDEAKREYYGMYMFVRVHYPQKKGVPHKTQTKICCPSDELVNL